MHKHFLLFIFATVIGTVVAKEKRFPKDFRFGASTSAHQIEGAWNVDGKGPSIWDEFVHNFPERIKNRANADVGANSYEYYMDDIEAIKYLNLDFYRFSISWSRIMPNGDITNVNEKGIEYYNKLIDKLLENGIEPMVTMYHWDLPLTLQSFGGLTSSLFISYFEAYANLLFERFGDRVKIWNTFNEPVKFCAGYSSNDIVPPLVDYHGIGDYWCAHNILKAHANVYHLYKKIFYERFKGQIGINFDANFFYPDNNDTAAVDRALQFSLGRLAHPIFSEKGNYPNIVIERVAENSKRENRPFSRLPTFSEEWINKIRGSADFLGVNTYTSQYASTPNEPVGRDPSIERDQNVIQRADPNWKQSINGWIYSVPEGLGDLLRWIKKEYNNPVVYITENGWADSGELSDDDRVEYIHDHLQEIRNVVIKEECNLKGYFVWSLIDNFEWSAGYTEKFGLFAVNFTSPRKERTPKKSANFMRKVTTTHQIPSIY